MMRARSRSYGDTSTRTRSPGRMRILNRRILPATWPSTSWPLSSCTLNMAFGSASTTSPSNSTFSSFAKQRPRVVGSDRAHVRGLRSLGSLAELVLDLRSLAERTEAVAFDGGEMDERVLPAVIRGDEPESLLVAEPLHDSGCHLVQHLRCGRTRCAEGCCRHCLPACSRRPGSGPDGRFIPAIRRFLGRLHHRAAGPAAHCLGWVDPYPGASGCRADPGVGTRTCRGRTPCRRSPSPGRSRAGSAWSAAWSEWSVRCRCRRSGRPPG